MALYPDKLKTDIKAYLAELEAHESKDENVDNLKKAVKLISAAVEKDIDFYMPFTRQTGSTLYVDTKKLTNAAEISASEADAYAKAFSAARSDCHAHSKLNRFLLSAREACALARDIHRFKGAPVKVSETAEISAVPVVSAVPIVKSRDAEVYNYNSSGNRYLSYYVPPSLRGTAFDPEARPASGANFLRRNYGW